ncbi:hypothetical protein PMI36_01479 [Pseudomonas sp. GM79]|uniref:hypothetical protein n=1 Tax=Pseudomonas sp. GM79 TaxID=1144338 RepID=UPI00026F6181|nr:hypothetical protein [Pseudomonas sp. GM79]EJN25861.1 hypothetical protein PMI36_01479 [Pseudomonas sp. GM79]
MMQIERFPVSKKDLEHKNISGSARKLIKALGADLKLGQGREMIARILGYSNCHELEQEAKNSIDCSLPTFVEKSKAYLKVAINISNTLSIPLPKAIGLVNQLGLHYYSAMKNGQANTSDVESLEFQIEPDGQTTNQRESTAFSYHCKDANVVVTFKQRRKIIAPLDA